MDESGDVPYVYTQTDKKLLETFFANRNENLLFSARFRENRRKWNKTVDEEKVLMIGEYGRVFVFNAAGKVLNDAHILDLVEIQTPTPKDILLKFRNFSQGFANTAKSGAIIAAIRKAFVINFPGMPTTFLGELDDDFTDPIYEIGTCGGFSRAYRSTSDYYNAPVREDVILDVDTLYAQNNVREMNLNEWPDPLTPQQARAVIEALKYNTWFVSITVNGTDVRVGNEGIVGITGVLQQNKLIYRLELVSVGAHEAWITNEVWMTFALNNYLTDVSLSNNPIEDKGVSAMCAHWLSTVCHEIFTLKLDKCGIGPKGMSTLFKTMRENKWVGKNIRYVSVSNNRMEDSTGEMMHFLKEAVSLHTLEMAYTNPSYAALRSTKYATSRPLLTKINFAGNRMQKSEALADLSYFFQNISPSLTDLDLSAVNLIPTQTLLRNLLEGVPHLTSFNLADNDIGEDGIEMLVECLIGQDPQPLLKLKSLYLDRTITINPLAPKKLKGTAVRALSALISPSAFLLCPLEVLKFSGGPQNRLKTDVLPFINAIAHAETLQELDISGQHIGDDLAAALARVLQSNKSLRTIFIDENQLTVLGLEHLAMGLRRNRTVHRMPIPVLDISEQLKLPENSQSMQQLKERLKLTSADSDAPTIQLRCTQLVAEIQLCITQNAVRNFKEGLKTKVAAKKQADLKAKEESNQNTSPSQHPRTNNNNILAVKRSNSPPRSTSPSRSTTPNPNPSTNTNNSAHNRPITPTPNPNLIPVIHRSVSPTPDPTSVPITLTRPVSPTNSNSPQNPPISPTSNGTASTLAPAPGTSPQKDTVLVDI